VTEALFVLSTGRCGTQWLAGVLARACADRAEVTHEPLDSDYAPRAMLAAGDPAGLAADIAAPIHEHVAVIEETLATKSYIECGHPLWSTLPYLLERFAGRARVVHLVRHPVPTAFSWVTQSVYTPPLSRHVEEKVLLSPFDEGVQFPEYRHRWPSLTPYEKALYYWAEVNAFGLRLEERTEVPWLRVRFEDLLRGAALPRLLEFTGIDADSTSPARAVDDFHFVTTSWSDPRAIGRHPEVVRVAEALGYDPLRFDEEQLRRRYSAI
jgi:hypothetical protein